MIIAKDFILRPPRKTDLLDYYNCRNDPIIAKNMYRGIYPLSLKQAKGELDYIIRENNKDSESFIIEIKGKLAGSIYLWDIQKNHKARVGYWLGKEYRNKGIITKALKIITN
jgi:RimJ/RimL family protein N-acetyltransferase